MEPRSRRAWEVLFASHGAGEGLSPSLCSPDRRGGSAAAALPTQGNVRGWRISSRVSNVFFMHFIAHLPCRSKTLEGFQLFHTESHTPGWLQPQSLSFFP